jgi:RNA methyltransferase, TrmH family
MPPFLLVLESIEKPGNLGAILRTASGAGVDLVLICGRSVDLCNPNVLRSSTGAVFSTPVVALPLPDLLSFLNERRIRSVATVPKDGSLYTEVDLCGPVAIVMGAEDTGLSADWLQAAVEKARIPMHGTADSLNLSVSAALMVYEAERQRHLAR